MVLCVNEPLILCIGSTCILTQHRNLEAVWKESKCRLRKHLASLLAVRPGKIFIYGAHT
jgi:hypothetical protein